MRIQSISICTSDAYIQYFSIVLNNDLETVIWILMQYEWIHKMILQYFNAKYIPLYNSNNDADEE